MVCDFDYNVEKIRPECRSNKGLTHEDEALLPEDIFGILQSMGRSQEEGSGFVEETAEQEVDIFSQLARSVKGVKSSLTEEVTKGRRSYEVNDLAASYFASETTELDYVFTSLSTIGQEFSQSGQLSLAAMQQLNKLVATVKQQRSSIAQKLVAARNAGKIAGSALQKLMESETVLQTVERELERQVLLLQGSSHIGQKTNQIAQTIGKGIVDEAVQALKPEKLAVKPGQEGEECSATANVIPHIAHESDCSKFYHCVPTHGRGGQLVLKRCSPGTMFNPKNLICDWPINVYKIKPLCKEPGDDK